MADVQFEEESQYQRPAESEKKSFFIRLVLATGIVSTDRQAEYVLLGVAALALVLAFMIPSFIGGSQKPVPQSVVDKALRLPPPRY